MHRLPLRCVLLRLWFRFQIRVIQLVATSYVWPLTCRSNVRLLCVVLKYTSLNGKVSIVDPREIFLCDRDYYARRSRTFYDHSIFFAFLANDACYKFANSAWNLKRYLISLPCISYSQELWCRHVMLEFPVSVRRVCECNIWKSFRSIWLLNVTPAF